MTEQAMKFIIVEGRRPQDGSEPMRAKLIFDARLSHVGLTAGAARAHPQLSDCGLVEVGDWPHALGYTNAEVESIRHAGQRASIYATALEDVLKELAKALSCRMDNEVMLARIAILTEDSKTLHMLNESMKLKEAALPDTPSVATHLPDNDPLLQETFAPPPVICGCDLCVSIEGKAE